MPSASIGLDFNFLASFLPVPSICKDRSMQAPLLYYERHQTNPEVDHDHKPQIIFISLQDECDNMGMVVMYQQPVI